MHEFSSVAKGDVSEAELARAKLERRSVSESELSVGVSPLTGTS